MKKIFTLAALVVLIALNTSAQWMRKYTLYYQPSGQLVDSAAYFNNGLINDSIVDYAPIGANQFSNSYRQVFERDSNGNIVIQTNSIFNSTWELNNRILNNYNGSQQLVETIYQMYESGAWLNSIRMTYTYETNGIWMLEMSSVWNGTAWEYNWQQEYTNNNVGHVSSIEYIYVDAMWQQSASHTFTYTDGLLTQNLKLDELGEPMNKMEYTYDVDESLLYFRNSEWNANAMDWVYTDRYFTYDEYGNLVNELSGYQVYTGKTIDYFIGTNIVHVYELVTAVMEQDTQSILVISPNPAVNYFNIIVLENQSALHVYDGQSRVVDVLNLSKGTHQVDIMDYPSGIYYLVLQHSKGRSHAKLLVK